VDTVQTKEVNKQIACIHRVRAIPNLKVKVKRELPDARKLGIQ